MLEAAGVSKHYGGVAALAPTDFTVRPGTVHALLGENGAGKSTLVKILTGSVAPDQGRLLIDGSPVRFAHTADAARGGVAVVSQELSLFPELSVLANLFTMREPRRRGLLDRREMARRAAPVLEELGLAVDVTRPLGELSLPAQQLVEIGRALLTEPRVLVLDEPTSALAADSTQNLLRLVRVLRSRGAGVVFVSHILEEVLSVADEVTVLRDGRTVLDREASADLDIPAIVAAMLGAASRAPGAGPVPGEEGTGDGPAAPLPAAVVAAAGQPLQISGVRLTDESPALDLTAPPGEILGLAGLAGAGQQHLLELMAGLAKPRTGQVLLPGGRPVPRPRRAAVAAGVALVSGDRRRLGLMLDKPLWENIAQVRSVALRRDGVFIRRSELRRRAAGYLQKLGIKARSVDSPAGALSGGNQQKVVVATWLELEPSVLLLDDPTRGVDVGAKREMHALIRAMADAGAVVVLCSTDNQELAELCDRVAVFYQGALAGELAGARLDQHTLLESINTGNVQEAA
ncbi:MAG TPA: sugar ABC transporter ATP-binding protein [Streptosporangiaceae bacterium]|jgi:ABC-type sugar transport system ATPase subunit